jgi:hypothetical protein
VELENGKVAGTAHSGRRTEHLAGGAYDESDVLQKTPVEMPSAGTFRQEMQRISSMKRTRILSYRVGDFGLLGLYFFLVLFARTIGTFSGGGFRLTAVINSALAISIFFLLAGALLFQHVKKRRPLVIEKKFLPIFLVLVAMIGAGLVLGMVNGNPALYVVSTFIYWTNYLMFMVLASSRDFSGENLFGIIKWIAIAATVLAIFKFALNNSILILLISMFVVYSMGERRVGAALLCLLPLILNASALNRSGMLAVLICLTAGAIMYRWPIFLSFLLAAVIAFILVFPSIDVSKVAEPGTFLNRRLVEVQNLMNGTQSIDDMVALQQRLYEIREVNNEMEKGGALQKILGAGFGKTIDMSSSSDESVKTASTLGAAKVHNIHSLPHSIYLRSGLTGLVFLSLIIFQAIRLCLQAMQVKKASPLLGLCILYPLGIIVSAMPASNYLFMEFILLAMLVQASKLIQKESHLAKKSWNMHRIPAFK